MRPRIIAYGVAVMLVLLSVSLFTFRAMRPRPFHAPNRELLERILAAPDPATRQHLVDQVLDENRVALTIYAPDGALLATNVQPPLPAEPPAPRARPARALDDDHGPGPAFALSPPPPHALEPALTPGALFTSPGRQRKAPPGVLVLAGAQLVTQPLPPPDTTLATFAAPLILTVCALILLSFPVTAALTRRLDALAETARRFGEGDLGQRAELAHGSDELSRTARAFNMMAERLAEQRQRERVLLANVSHELRTPMARMAVLLELSESNPEQAVRYQRELRSDLRELETLLERITDTFRVELAPERAIEHSLARRTSSDLREVALHAANDFRALAPERTLDLELPPEPVVRDVDPILLRRAVMNLLDNARKYSPVDAAIHLRVEPAGEIVVTDGGDGIAPAHLPHVFEPFFRADPSRNRATGGVGLGLGFVKMVARLHDGDVSVASPPGSGCTFRITLPRAALPREA